MIAEPATRPRRPLPSRTVRGAAKGLLRGYGMLTSGLRPLPDFVIIGAKRGGTTSLYNYLLAHPSVLSLFPAAQKIKGVHFFENEFRRGVSWYRSHFPTAVRRRLATRSGGGGVVAGEASPYYLFHPHAPARAARFIPRARLIVLLRNPVDRAYSHYSDRVRHGVETLSFEEAIDREPERLQREIDRMQRDEWYPSFAHEHFSYVTQGEYAGPLRRWLSLFPAHRVTILLSEDFYRDPDAVYQEILAFLGLPRFLLQDFPAYNFHPRTPEMDPSTRERLLRHFAPHNRDLADFLGRDLRGWDA